MLNRMEVIIYKLINHNIKYIYEYINRLNLGLYYNKTVKIIYLHVKIFKTCVLFYI